MKSSAKILVANYFAIHSKYIHINIPLIADRTGATSLWFPLEMIKIPNLEPPPHEEMRRGAQNNYSEHVKTVKVRNIPTSEKYVSVTNVATSVSPVSSLEEDL